MSVDALPIQAGGSGCFSRENTVRHHAISRNAASDERATLLVNHARECRSPDSFGNLGQRELFEVKRVTVKFADAFGELFRRHCVLVVHPAEGLLVQVEPLFLASLRSD